MLRRFARLLQISACTFLFLIAFGCGGSSNNNSGGSGNAGQGGSNQNPPPVVAITITPTSVTLAAGATQQFQAAVTGSSNTAVTWQVNGVAGGSPQSGTISSTGLYTAPSPTDPLQVTVTAVASADTSKTAVAAVTVNPPPPPPPPVIIVAISPTSVTMAVSTTQQFTATVTGTSNIAVTWSVDGINGGNANVGTVSASGLYTAPAAAAGHTVTATSVADTSKSATATVTLVSLMVYPQNASVTPLGTRLYNASVQGIQNTGVTWSVDGVSGGNSSVGTIDSKGHYTAPGKTGSHTITATASGLPTYSVNASVSVVAAPPGVTAMLTYHSDLARDGANLQETTLTPANVNAQQFGKLMSLPVDGQVYAQPLYVPNLKIKGVQHNVVFVATENDSVYAFDGDGLSDSPLWMQHVGTPAPVNDKEGIRPLLGITATPVIDSVTGTMYVLSDNLENGKKVFRLHALNLSTGNEKFGGPAVVTGTVPGAGWDNNNGQITLETSCYQRNGLALDDSTNAIYITFGHCNHGWVLAYDKSSLQQTAIFNDTADGAGGGFWGGTPAIDSSTGDLYIISGSDLNDPAPGYNNSALRLQATDLSVLDYFKPADDGYLRQNDADFGSGAPVLMPDNSSQYPHELIGGGKDGRIFVMDRDDMGQFQMTDHVIQIVQTGVSQFDNIFDTPTFWNGHIYYHCENDVVKSYYWDGSTGLLSNAPTTKGTKVYGVHGATASLSANGNSEAVLWEIESTGAPSSGPAILHAYDALNLGKELYNSQQSGMRDTAGPAVKFTVPTVTDGHVYVGTASELDIYGPLGQ